MKTLATTTNAADWFLLGHLATHSAAITAQPTAIAIEATLAAVACGPAGVNNISTGTTPSVKTMVAIM